MLTLVEHLSLLYYQYADYDLSNNSRSKSCFEIKLIISVNIIEGKIIFDLTGFETRTSGSAVQYPNH